MQRGFRSGQRPTQVERWSADIECDLSVFANYFSCHDIRIYLISLIRRQDERALWMKQTNCAVSIQYFTLISRSLMWNFWIIIITWLYSPESPLPKLWNSRQQGQALCEANVAIYWKYINLLKIFSPLIYILEILKDSYDVHEVFYLNKEIRGPWVMGLGSSVGVIMNMYWFNNISSVLSQLWEIKSYIVKICLSWKQRIRGNCHMAILN